MMVASQICIEGGTGEWQPCTCPGDGPRTTAGCTPVDPAGFVVQASAATLEDPGAMQQADGIPVGVHSDAGVLTAITALWASDSTTGIIRVSNLTVAGVVHPGVRVTSETVAVAAVGSFVPAAEGSGPALLALLGDPPPECKDAAVVGLLDGIYPGCAVPTSATTTTLYTGSSSNVYDSGYVVALWGSRASPSYASLVSGTATVYDRGGIGVQLIASEDITALGPTRDPGEIVATTATKAAVFNITTGQQLRALPWPLHPSPGVADKTTVVTQGCALVGSPCDVNIPCCVATQDLRAYEDAVNITYAPAVEVAPETLNSTLALNPLYEARFYGADSPTEFAGANSTDGVELPPPSPPPPIMGRRAMGFNQRGGDEAFRRLLGSCDRARCSECDQSRVANADSEPVAFADRDPMVRGQNATASTLGTYFRAGDVNEYAWLATRGGADWAVNASYVDGIRTGIWGGKPYNPAKGSAFYNRWYADQTRNPGTPLWPASAKSDFGLCCAYLYAAYGTNGYRPHHTEVAQPPQKGLKTTPGIRAESSYNAAQPAWKGLDQFPPFPDNFRNHTMCYTGGKFLSAEITEAQRNQSCSATYQVPVPPLGCRVPFTPGTPPARPTPNAARPLTAVVFFADDWMSDDEKTIVRKNTGQQEVNQSKYLHSALWPAEGCESSYDCELPQLSTTTPDSCDHPITNTNCKLCSSGDENCLPPRHTLAVYNYSIEYTYLCGYRETPTCKAADTGCHLEKDTNKPTYCTHKDDCTSTAIHTTFQNAGEYPLVMCMQCNPEGIACLPSPCPYVAWSCKSNPNPKVSTPFVFGEKTGLAYTVPAIGDPDSPKLQRRMFAMCRKCGGNTNGKCCDATAYTAWKALEVKERESVMDRVYVKTRDWGEPVATTRKYPFVWGADRGPSVEDDFRTYPPLFPPLDPNDPGPDFCDTVAQAAPVGCAENITNIAAKRGRNVARRTIIFPSNTQTPTSVKRPRKGFVTCPPQFSIGDPASCSSTPSAVKNGSYSQPKGCYLSTTGTYFSYGNGSNPIPDNVTALCHAPVDTMDAPVVACSQQKFSINSSLMAGGLLPRCDDPTDWRCRFDCNY